MQLTGSRKIIGGLALCGAVALTGIVGFAQQQTTQGQDGNQGRTERQWRGGKGDDGKRGGSFEGRFAEKLNLTDAQKEQMKQIAARYRESTKAMRQQERGERGGFEALKGGTFDEAAVRAAAQARANARVEMEVAHARMMSEMYNVLTPEQKAQLAAERQQREQKRQEWRARRNQNSGQTQ
ncbi:MAG TPA: Spy/CpxP family protein refolding chaperone [Pyrinomonadaceae bacterium]|jgi:Spy/CpxP family protein refolding chaperone|nr:Spy/CpxP family protein refolding chaperone [Pyrinomonadaceae bacterium]